MIDAKTNRIFFDALLKAPEGYTFHKAITTTYSLDLEAILLVPVALFFSEDLDFNPNQAREDILESLTKASERISIFCQRGKIKVPNTYNKLTAFWEKGIHQIQMPDYRQSFHPKIWLIRYESEEKETPAFYRFLCTSRNLTSSRDWDLAVSAEGYVEKDTAKDNKGIRDMLDWLNVQHKESIPGVFFEEIGQVNFNVPSPFRSIQFHPIGISEEYKNIITEQTVMQDERLLMSPFLKEKTLEQLSNKAKKIYLFSSNHELAFIQKSFLSQLDDVYQFSPFIEDAEKSMELSEPGEIPMSQNLHAKFFIDRKGKETSWYIGSANATTPASDGNIEFVVQLNTTSKQAWPARIRETLKRGINKEISLFEKYPGSESEADEAQLRKEQQIRKLIHSLSDISIKGEVKKNEDKQYDLMITLPEADFTLPEEITVKVKPLPEKNKDSVLFEPQKEKLVTDFKGYDEVDLSPFLVIEILDNGSLFNHFVVDMDIELDDNRLDRIFTSIINSRTKFLNYLFFLISEEIPNTNFTVPNRSRGNNGSIGDEIAFFSGSPVYEKLLYTASRNSAKFISINKLIERLKNEIDDNGEPIISEEFLKMWNVFYSFAKEK